MIPHQWKCITSHHMMLHSPRAHAQETTTGSNANTLTVSSQLLHNGPNEEHNKRTQVKLGFTCQEQLKKQRKKRRVAFHGKYVKNRRHIKASRACPVALNVQQSRTICRSGEMNEASPHIMCCWFSQGPYMGIAEATTLAT